MHLFIYYNTRITDDDFKSLLDKGKKYHFVSFVQSQLKKGNKVRIITYNYDVLLERGASLHITDEYGDKLVNVLRGDMKEYVLGQFEKKKELKNIVVFDRER